MRTKRILLTLLATLMSGALVGQSAAQITAVSNNIVAANTSGSAYYTLGSIDGLGGDLTIEGWVYLSSYANFGRIADLGNGDANGNIILGTVGTTGVPTFQLFDGATFLGAAAGPDPLALNTWVHVAGVVQADRTMRLYVNGNEVATSTATADAPTISRSSNFIAESNWAQDSVLNGAVSDVRIWNSARSQAEIQAAMPVGSIAGPTTGLVAAFPFGATGAAPTADVSGTGITASQVGTISYSKFDTGTLTTGGFNGADLNVAEGQLNLTGTNSVGRLSVNSATVTQAAGSSVTTTATGEPALQIGVSAGQNGSYTTSGGTLDVANSGMAFIGVSGNGSMTQTGGAVSTGSWTVLGRFAGSTGSYDISGGTLSHSATEPGSKIIVGEEGTGTLTVSDTGSVTSAGGISIAHAAGGVGTVNLDGGTISAASVSKGSGSTATFNFNGGTLGATGNNANFMSGLNVAEIKAGGAVIDDAGFEIGIGQVLSGTGALEKTGSGQLTLSGNNTYAGATTISEGNLRVGNDGTTGTLGSGNVVNNATLAFARSDALTVSQEISGTGEVRKWGFGTTTFTGANTFSGDFLQEYGVTVLNRTGGPALYADGGAGEVVIANLSGGANFYSAVEMGSADQLGSNVDVTFSPQDIANGYSYLSLHGNDTTIGNLKSTANHAAAWGIVQNQESGSFGDSTLTIHQTVDGSFTGEIRDGFGDNVGRLALVKEGAATLTLDSAGGGGLSYSGGTTVNGGTLVIGDTLLNTGNALTVNNGATVTFAHQDVLGVHTATITMPIALNDGCLLQNSGAVFNALGALTLNGGTLQANAVEAGSGQSFALKGAVTVTGNATSTIAGNGIALGAGSVTGTTFNVGDGTAATDLLVTGVLRDGSGATFGPTQVSSFTKTGAGAMVLAGSNTYTGATTISAGTLQVGDGGTSGSLGTGNVVNNGALAFNRSDSHSVSNVISGTGSLTKNGTGTVTLTGTNTYTGGTAVNAGELNVNGSIAGSAVTVSSGASLSGSGTVGAISGAGAINPGNSPGILTAPSVDGSGGMSFNFEFTSINPTYSNASASLNDVLRLTDATPFVASLGAANTVNIYFNVDVFEEGQLYTGGFFTDTPADFRSQIVDATFNYYVKNAGGAVSYGGQTYSALVEGLAVHLTTIDQSADFAGGTVEGQVAQFQVVPEPSTYALLALGAAALGAHAWRKRRRAAEVVS